MNREEKIIKLIKNHINTRIDYHNSMIDNNHAYWCNMGPDIEIDWFMVEIDWDEKMKWGLPYDTFNDGFDCGYDACMKLLYDWFTMTDEELDQELEIIIEE